MNRWQIIEFVVLIIWSIVFGWCTLKGISVPPACSAAYVAFVSAVAVKNTFGQ